MSQVNRIYILAGQSWIDGVTNTIDNLQSPYKNNYLHNTRIWNGSNQFYPLYSPSNNNQLPNKVNGFTTAFYFKDIADYLGDDIYLIKYAIGSTALYKNGSINDWNANSVGEYLDTLKTYMSNVEAWMDARGKSYVWGGILWMQGEEDSKYLSHAQVYQANLQGMYDALCAATGVTLKIWQHRIEAIPGGGNRPYRWDIHLAKQAFTDLDTANRRYFNPNTTKWLGIHPSPEGNLDMWNNYQKPLIKADL